MRYVAYYVSDFNANAVRRDAASLSYEHAIFAPFQNIGYRFPLSDFII
jgi:hypothetical protein